MSFRGLSATDYEARVNFDRLRKERLEKARAAMAKHEVDALLLARASNVRYVTASRLLDVVSGAPDLPAAMITKESPGPYHWTICVDSVSDLVAPDHLFSRTWHPVQQIGQIGRILGASGRRTVAVDRLAPYLMTTLASMLPQVKLVDGTNIMLEARSCKTQDEIECLRIAQAITDGAMNRVLAALRPGTRDVDLHGIFLQEIGRAGTTFPVHAGVYAAQPKTRAEALYSSEGAAPYRQLSADAIFGEGEMVTIETGTFYLGYMALFGRTWYCSFKRKPSPKEKDLYKKWKELFDRIAEQCRPGKTAADLRRAAGNAVDSAARYLVHGIGLGLEPPVVGQDVDQKQAESWTLAPGMVLTVAPYVWEEGVGGFRASETLVITKEGREQLTCFPHGPLSE